jgi:transcriptional regulator with XRE-family HTH domain
VQYYARMASDGTSALREAMGARVRAERLERRWTLDQLAEAAGVSRRLLVSVEQGDANPSIGTLLRLSDALGVGLPALVAPPIESTVTITRQGSGALLWESPAGGAARLMVGTQPPDVLELWDWTLAPGDRHTSAPHAAGTTELLQVLEGAITIEVGDAAYALAAGDAAAFRGDLAHAYRNDAVPPARFSLAVFEPGVAPSSLRRETHRDGRA